MRISNFFEIRFSFVCFRGNFVLVRAFMVRHCCYSLLQATEPWRIRSFGFLYSENSPNVKSRYVFHSGRTDRRFELRRITQFECPKLLERFARGSSHLFKREQ
jgi:hypothetical protein